MTRLASVALLLLVRGDFEAGVQALRDGRQEEALAEFRALREEAGDKTSAALHYNIALVALQTGDLDECEQAAQAAAQTGGGNDLGRALFLQGNVAYERCLRSEGLALRPEAEPFLLQQTLQYARDAAEFWRQALDAGSGRPESGDWPAARRNLERAFLKVAELEGVQQEREDAKNKPPEDPPPEEEAPSPEDRRHDVQSEQDLAVPVLSDDEVEGLLRQLLRNDEEKRRLRRLERQHGSGRVERDW